MVGLNKLHFITTFSILILQRYYGRSLPFGKKSYERANIEFLTVEQAVADFVVLVTKLKADLDAENCPVIAFGGRYSLNF